MTMARVTLATVRRQDYATQLTMSNRTRTETIVRTERPWGWFETVSEAPGSKTKRIHVLPGQQISLQKHQHRAEHWVVTLGTAWVTRDGEAFELHTGQHCDIACGQVHRLANPGTGGLEIVEVQFGSHLEESDIIRLQDDYGRQ